MKRHRCIGDPYGGGRPGDCIAPVQFVVSGLMILRATGEPQLVMAACCRSHLGLVKDWLSMMGELPMVAPISAFDEVRRQAEAEFGDVFVTEPRRNIA